MTPWSGGWDSNPLTHRDRIYSPAPLSNSTAPRNICLVLYMSDLNLNNLPVQTVLEMSLYRSDTSRRIVKTGPVQAPVLGGSIRHARTFAIALVNKKSYLYAVAANSTTTITLGRIFRTLKSFADLRHTLYNLHLYSISRETRSELWVATP